MSSISMMSRVLLKTEVKSLHQTLRQLFTKSPAVNIFRSAKSFGPIVNPERSYLQTVYSHRYYSLETAAEHKVVNDYRSENNVTVIGKEIPSPYTDIDSSEFPDSIKQYLKQQGFTKPSVIQAQAWPIALSGQNMVGIAQTGTGKTLAYLLPAAVHINNTPTKRGRGPRVLVLAPTRELARQIEVVAKDLQRLLSIRCLCIHGGVSRVPQMSELQAGVDILIATPGRLNDFIVSKNVALNRCSYVVLDEADRMLDMGFEPQIRQALEGVPLERQILMFSATWPKEVQHLAKEYLGEFVQVNVGSTELVANHNIEQFFHITEDHKKLEQLESIMRNISGDGFRKILLFTNTKKYVDTLTLMLRRNGWKAEGIHGDKTQMQRDKIIGKFRSGSSNILVATDVAARGLDVEGVTHVINFDFPQTSEDYIHRIGRTGRQDNKGVSHSLLTRDDERHAHSLIAILKEANQEIPKGLQDMAQSYNTSKTKVQEARKVKRNWSPYSSPSKKWNKFRNPRQQTFRY